MSRKRGLSSLLSGRKTLYSVARKLADVNAVTRGPTKIGKRLVRKSLWKGFSKTLRKFGL